MSTGPAGEGARPAGRYFEELDVGDVFVSPARTVTEADVVAFAGLSGDYNALHTDEELARASPFGRRIAHGMLGMSILTGLTARLGLFEGTAIAFLGLEWRFTAPIFIGDTVHCELEILEKRETRNAERGVLVRGARLVNQRGEVTQEGTSTIMIARAPQPAAAELSRT